jgi:hypothetical protein
VILNFNKLVSKLCCNFSIPIVHSQMHVHQNKFLAQIFILYISQFEPSSTSLHNVQSIVECWSQNAVQNIEKQKQKKIVHFTKSIFKNCNIRIHTKYPTENTASTSVCTPKNLTLYYHCKLLTTPTLITPHMRIWVLRLQSGEDMGLSELTSHSKCSAQI